MMRLVVSEDAIGIWVQLEGDTPAEWETLEGLARPGRADQRAGAGRFCAGPRRIAGAVMEPHAVRRLLAALGLAAEPPPARPVTAS